MTKQELLQVISEAAHDGRDILDLKNKGIEELPAEIRELVKIEILELNNNRLTTLPPEIASLVNLRSLRLFRNRLAALPREITKLINLESLYLDQNQLVSLPLEIKDLTNLGALSITRNQLTHFPSEILTMTNLGTLFLDRNHLTSLPAEIKKLVNLRTLDLAGNQLTSIPAEITALTKLESLNLGRNELTTVPAGITGLEYLENLNISGNKLDTPLSGIENLTGLRHLSLDEKQLRQSAEAIIQLKDISLDVWTGDDYHGIAREVMSTFTSGRELIAYYFKTQTSGSRALNEAKIIIIGQGNVGKTSLRQRLTGEPYTNLGRTEGVEIKRWKTDAVNDQTKRSEKIKLNVWDFGGQEIYHTTHQFFFRSRCLYILVIDARLGVSESRLHYWLRQAQAFGKNAPVIVVLNKAEEKDSQSIDRRYERERENVLALKEIFPGIFDCILVSCDKELEISKVEQGIGRAITEKMPEVFSTLPGKWFEVKEKLEALNENYLPEEKFDEICAEVPEDERKQLTQILDALGIIVSFDDQELSDTKIIKPEWITRGIYKILSSYKLDEKNGRLTPEEIYEIFAGENDYPAPKVEYILRLMEKYDLCYIEEGDKGKENLLFPVAFSVAERKHQPLGANTTQFEYRYKNEYYDSIIVRFLKAAYEEYGPEFYYWRKGVTGRLNGHQIYILADDVSNRIEIKIDGVPGGRCKLLEAILATIDKIHKDFGKLEVEKVLLHPKNGNSFQYEQVVLRKESGKPSIGYINNEGDAVNVPIDYLLDGIEGEEIKEEEVSEEVKRLEEALAGLRKSDNQEIARLKERIGDVFAELERAASDSEKMKNGLDNEAEKIVKIYAGVLFFCISFILMLWIVLILWVGWDTMEKWTYIVGILSLMLFYGIMFLTLSEPNPLKFFERRKQKTRDSLYKEFGFNIITHQERKQKLKDLKP